MLHFFHKWNKFFVIALLVCVFIGSAGVRLSFGLTEEETRSFFELAYRSAGIEQLKKNINLASMYFVNALSFKPGDMRIISDYVDMILAWSKDNPNEAVSALNAMSAFLAAQVVNVRPGDIPRLLELQDNVALQIEKSLSLDESGNETQVNLAKEETVRKNIESIRAGLKNSKNLSEYVSSLKKMDELIVKNELEDTELSEELQIALNVESAIKHTKELISRGDALNVSSPLKMSYMQLAESSLQQSIAMSLYLPIGLMHEFEDLKMNVDDSILKNKNGIKINWSSVISVLLGGIIALVIALYVYCRQRKDNRETKRLQIKADIMSSLAELLLLTENMQYATLVINHEDDFVRARENFRKSLYKNMPYLDFDPTCYTLPNNHQRWDIEIINAFNKCFFKTNPSSEESLKTLIGTAMELMRRTIERIKDSDIKINC